MKNPFENNLLDFYEYLLRGPLFAVYSAKKRTTATETIELSNLIIDKFAIHSSSFFILSKGIIEVKKSGEQLKATGYDLFTVNSTFRTMMENYATFHNIFIEAKTEDERLFRSLLWKIDGLYDKQKLDIRESDFDGAKAILENDQVLLANTINEFESSRFYKSLNQDQLIKIYKPASKKFSWRFTLNENGTINALKISDLIKHTCKTRAFINTYRYTSIHTHTNYLAIEHFKQTRGKPISEEHTNPITQLAISLTCLIIKDMCSLDENARNEFQSLPDEVKEYIDGICRIIKKS